MHTHGITPIGTLAPHWLLFPKVGVQHTSSMMHLPVDLAWLLFLEVQANPSGWLLVIFLGSPEPESLLGDPE